jgi:hypothetical protein
MKRLLILAAMLTLGACASHYKELPAVHSGDPVWQLNPDRWTAHENDLITPPADGASRPLAAPVRAASTKVPADAAR